MAHRIGLLIPFCVGYVCTTELLLSYDISIVNYEEREKKVG